MSKRARMRVCSRAEQLFKNNHGRKDNIEDTNTCETRSLKPELIGMKGGLADTTAYEFD